MLSSIATYKESLSRIASEVLDAAEELDDASADLRRQSLPSKDASPSQAAHARRRSRLSAESISPSGSQAANGADSASKDEITKYKEDIQKLQASEAEIKALSFSYAAMLKEKEEQLSRLHEENGSLRKSLEERNSGGSPRTLSISSNLSKGVVDTSPTRPSKNTIQGNMRPRGNLASKLTLSKHDGLSNGVVQSNQIYGARQKNDQNVGNLESERELLHEPEENNKPLSDLESEISQLRAQLAKEQDELASFKTRFQEEHHQNESVQKELKDLKMDTEKTSVEMKELKMELNKKTIEMKRLQIELDKTKSERESLESVENLKTIINKLQEENGRLKEQKTDLELTLKEKSDTGVSSPSQHTDRLNELEKSLDDAHSERDKAIQELTRLKQHLLDQELDEANKMDEDNKIMDDLRSKIEHQRAQVLHMEKTLRQETSKREEITKLHQEELHKSNEIVNGLTQKLVNSMKAIDSKNLELLNLQTALGQYYAESEAKERLARGLAAAKEECAKLSQALKISNLDIEKLKGEQDEAVARYSQAERAISDSKQSIKKLEEENSKLRRALEQSMTRLNRMSLDSDNYVDRRIVIKLLVTYFQRNHSKEVLDLISRMLGFSEEEKLAVGINRSGAGKGVVRGVLGLPGRLVGGIIGGSSHEARSHAPPDNQSFADLWVDFLLKESEERERRELAEAARLLAIGHGSSDTPASVSEHHFPSPPSTSSNPIPNYTSPIRSRLFDQPDSEFATVSLTSSASSSPANVSKLSRPIP